LSRNKERLGGVQQPDTSPPPQMTQAASEGSGFSFVVPTEIIELPSKGRYYPEGHVLHGEDNIEIRQMTAKEEDMLTSKTLLKKGIALDRVISSLIVDKRINPDSLLVGDRNALVIAARVTGYGSEYITQVTCPSCEEKQDYKFDLNAVNIYEGGRLEDLEVTTNEDGTFDVVLPRIKVRVTFKLLTGRDEKSVISGIESDRKRKMHERNVTRQLVNIIAGVNGDSSQEAINYLVQNIPSSDSRHLRLAYKLVAPNIDLTQHFECIECDFEQDMEVPLTADFFWPDR
jgi:hypothetical protein